MWLYLLSLIPVYPRRLCLCVSVLCLNADLLPPALAPLTLPWLPGCVWRKLKTSQWQLWAPEAGVILMLLLLVTGPGCLANTNQYSAYFSWSVNFNWPLPRLCLYCLSLQINYHLSPHLLWPAICYLCKDRVLFAIHIKMPVIKLSRYRDTNTLRRSEKQSNFSILSLSVWSLCSTKHHITCDKLFGEYLLIEHLRKLCKGCKMFWDYMCVH